VKINVKFLWFFSKFFVVTISKALKFVIAIKQLQFVRKGYFVFLKVATITDTDLYQFKPFSFQRIYVI
jgi:hypothetical protein